MPASSRAWGAAETGSGHTSNARLAGGPASRIDDLLVAADTAVAAVSVPIDPETRRASDHYPVVATVAWPRAGVRPYW